MSYGPSIKIKNHQGFNLTLKSFEMHYTYEDYLEWSPEVLPKNYVYDTNKEIFQKIKNRVSKKFPPHFKLHFKELHDTELRENWLPHMYFVCDLDAHKPIQGKKCSSGMIYTWLAEFPLNKTIQEIVTLELKTLDWAQYARDFDY